MAKKRKQIERTRAFKKKHARRAEAALERLQAAALGDGNVFEELVRAVEFATVGQVTQALWEVWGRFRASM
jgi:isobutyryl-CoA mutase